MAYNPWSDIMQMSDTEFNQLRPIASSNDFFVVISGTDRGNRYTYRVAKRLRRHGIALAQDRVAEETRLVANAITARICQISQ